MHYLIKPAVVAMVAIALYGCRGDEPKRMPDTVPDITGHVKQLNPVSTTDDDILLRMEVEGLESLEMIYPQASVTVTDDTLIENKEGQRLKAGQIQQGDLVEVWFEGPVLESMPVQVTAKAVRVSMVP